VDYGQDLRFGLFLTPDAAGWERALLLAEVAEVSGLDLVTAQDHPYQAKHLDALTLLTVIAARSSSLRVALNVANLPLRPPVVLAKSIATLDLITGGRAELGLGAGPGAVRVDGRHHHVSGLHPGPAPAHRVEIWLGAYKPRMLRLTRRYADGWPSMGYADPDDLPAMNVTIDDAAREAGRDPSAVRRLYNIFGSFTSGGGRGITGPPQEWAEHLADLALREGMSTFIVGTDDVDDVRRFGEEVAPAVRDLVDAGRRSGVAARPDPGPDRIETAPVASAPATAATTAPAAGSALDVRPTPDDGTRLGDQAAWDESTRPTFPVPTAFSYSATAQAAPQHLVDVHDGLRAELDRLRDIVRQVSDGRLAVGDARSAINQMTLRQNNWTLGAYCEQYCRIVTSHHSLEDASVFPHLRRVQGAGPVIDRLTQEHHVIHDLLDGLDGALVALVGEEAGAVGRLQDVLDLVTDALRSHLSYEERELLHPLAQAGFY